MHRRTFLKAATAVAAMTATQPAAQAAFATPMRVIDCHIHLFDPTRPGGVPWPEQSDTVLYHPALPGKYAHLARPHNVVGAIAVECSPWIADNWWLYDVIERNSLMLGYIGDLLPDAPDFQVALDTLHRSPLFLGIRYGNLWGRDLGAAIERPEFQHGLRLLADAGLVLETANPNGSLIAAVLRVSDRIPNLRIVIDHLPNAIVPTEANALAEYEKALRELAQRPNIFVKGSEIVRRIGGDVPLDLGAYRSGLDQIWDLFGEERILFGSDWPNSDSVATYAEVFRIAHDYMGNRTESAQKKYFWQNSMKVYRWRARTAEQRRLHQV
jgi:L-fuconolactonase